MEENKKELEEAKIGDEEIGEVDGGLDKPMRLTKSDLTGIPDYLGKRDRFNESIQNKNDDLDNPGYGKGIGLLK